MPGPAIVPILWGLAEGAAWIVAAVGLGAAASGCSKEAEPGETGGPEPEGDSYSNLPDNVMPDTACTGPVVKSMLLDEGFLTERTEEVYYYQITPFPTESYQCQYVNSHGRSAMDSLQDIYNGANIQNTDGTETEGGPRTVVLDWVPSETDYNNNTPVTDGNIHEEAIVIPSWIDETVYLRDQYPNNQTSANTQVDEGLLNVVVPDPFDGVVALSLDNPSTVIENMRFSGVQSYNGISAVDLYESTQSEGESNVTFRNVGVSDAVTGVDVTGTRITGENLVIDHSDLGLYVGPDGDVYDFYDLVVADNAEFSSGNAIQLDGAARFQVYGALFAGLNTDAPTLGATNTNGFQLYGPILMMNTVSAVTNGGPVMDLQLGDDTSDSSTGDHRLASAAFVGNQANVSVAKVRTGAPFTADNGAMIGNTGDFQNAWDAYDAGDVTNNGGRKSIYNYSITNNDTISGELATGTSASGTGQTVFTYSNATNNGTEIDTSAASTHTAVDHCFLAPDGAYSAYLVVLSTEASPITHYSTAASASSACTLILGGDPNSDTVNDSNGTYSTLDGDTANVGPDGGEYWWAFLRSQALADERYGN